MYLAIHEKHGSREHYPVQFSTVQTHWTVLTPDLLGQMWIIASQRGTRRTWKPGCTGPVKHSRRISCPRRRLDLVAEDRISHECTGDDRAGDPDLEQGNSVGDLSIRGVRGLRTVRTCLGDEHSWNSKVLACEKDRDLSRAPCLWSFCSSI